MAHPFIEHLEKDHEEQRRLGEQLQQVESPEEREQLRDEMYEALLPHVEGEDASIFSFMTSAGGEAREEALKAMQEHHVAKLVLRELMDLDPGGEVFSAKAYVLDELNSHHMDEEEDTHFPMLEEMASQEELDRLFEQYHEAEEKQKKSMK
jgi:hemerythrin-like domain-containing protein